MQCPVTWNKDNYHQYNHYEMIMIKESNDNEYDNYVNNDGDK